MGRSRSCNTSRTVGPEYQPSFSERCVMLMPSSAESGMAVMRGPSTACEAAMSSWANSVKRPSS